MSHFSMHARLRTEQSGHRVMRDGLASVWQYWNVGCDVSAWLAVCVVVQAVVFGAAGRVMRDDLHATHTGVHSVGR